jgi:two-component system sensor histidine kinase YesM
MKHLLQRFRNLNFRKKVEVVTLSVSLIPVIVLGTFTYHQVRDLLIEREHTALKDSLENEVYNLNYKINSYLNAMNLVRWDKDIQTRLSITYTNNFDMYETYVEVMDPLFATIHSLHNEINTITIYTDNPIYPHGTTLRPLSDIESSKWYPDVISKTTPFFVTSDTNQSLILVCQLYISNSDFTNIIYLNIDYSKTFRTLSSLFDSSYGLTLINENNQAIFNYSDFKDNEFVYTLSLKDFLLGWNNGTLHEDYVIEAEGLSSVNWQLFLYRPIEAVSSAANRITGIVILIIFICLIALFVVSSFLSRIVVQPLEELSLNMEKIQDGKMTVTVKNESKDEIGHLIQTFNHMVHRIRYLVDEVLKSKIAQQEYEMKALQAQINPHFLYNSLSLINGKAIISDQEEISQMAQLLTTFYRTTLNKGKNLITVNDELENTRSYISIQSMMHSNSYDVIYDIDQSLLSYTMINLLLQPLVENAISHGIDHKITPGRGLLKITSTSDASNLVFIVYDNGCGMEDEKQKSILTKETTGYGVQNVHHRVQLYYGTEFGLRYESKVNEGTTVWLTIPKR